MSLRNQGPRAYAVLWEHLQQLIHCGQKGRLDGTVKRDERIQDVHWCDDGSEHLVIH